MPACIESIAAAQCEWSLLRRLDEVLGRGEPRPAEADPLRDQVAEIGALHEDEVQVEVDDAEHRSAFRKRLELTVRA